MYCIDGCLFLKDILHARVEVRRAQQTLEEQQREEEDRLFQKFRVDRELEEKKIEREMIDEWERRLQVLTDKYEDDLQKKKDLHTERVRLGLIIPSNDIFFSRN